MVIALAGRRIDAPGAEVNRFPLANVDKVKEDLRKFFISTRPDALVCSGACGADLIALEVAGSLNIRRSVVLPFDAALFKSTSVIDRPGDWGDLYDKICKDVVDEEKIQVLGYSEHDDEAYLKTNFGILKRAEALADKYEVSEIVAVLVWEGRPKDKDDITEHFKETAEKKNFKIEEIITIVL
jgi:hypothetical protein